MTKQEFLENLRRSLTGNMEYGKVESHMRYYTEYIDVEIRRGRSEEEVMRELGDPRLIAKTILEMEETGANATSAEYQEYIDEEEPVRSRGRNVFFGGKALRLPGWAVTLIICVILMSVLSLAFTVISMIMPYVLFIFAGVFLYRFIRRLF